MSYEQEKNKIRKLWEQNQKNSDDIDKIKNPSIDKIPNNFLKKVKRLDNIEWKLFNPYYAIRSPHNAFIGEYSSEFGTVIGTIAAKNFDGLVFDTSYVHFKLSGGGTLEKRGSLGDNIYIFTSEERSQIVGYGRSYNIITRIIENGRWTPWSNPSTFSTYEQFPLPEVPTNIALANYSGQLPINTYNGPIYWINHSFTWDGTPSPGFAYGYMPTQIPVLYFSYDTYRDKYTVHLINGESTDMVLVNVFTTDPAYVNVSTVGGALTVSGPGGGNILIRDYAYIVNPYNLTNAQFKIEIICSDNCAGNIKISNNFGESGNIYNGGFNGAFISDWLNLTNIIPGTFWTSLNFNNRPGEVINFYSLKIYLRNYSTTYLGNVETSCPVI